MVSRFGKKITPLGGKGEIGLRFMRQKRIKGWVILFSVFLSAGVLYAQIEKSAIIESLTEYAKDENGNGLKESLVAEISINVNIPMIFTIETSLYSGDNLIIRKYKSNHLNKGINKVEVNFGGKRIRESQIDGPYTLEVRIYDKQRRQVSRATFETSFYGYNEFE